MSITPPFDSDGLWMKARLFINRALDFSTEFEEGAFWACCALELLGKCALARVNPLLIAMPTDDGISLLAASGVIEDSDSFVSIPAKAIWARCARAFRPFNRDEARELSLGRNSYLHSASIGFDVIPPESWWPRFWAQASILVAHCGRDIEELVGETRAKEVERHLETNRANLDRRLQSLLENARLRLKLHESGNMSGRMRSEWERATNPMFGWTHRVSAECPACGGDAMIGGDYVLERRAEHDSHDWDILTVTLTVATSEFYCDTCHLSILDPDALELTELPASFETEGDLEDVADRYEEEYNNE